MKRNRSKSLVFLLIVIILHLIFSTPLFNVYNKYCDNDNKERYQDFEYPLFSTNHPDNAYDYNYYKEITIDHTKVSGSADLIDFPVLISMFDSDLHNKPQIDGDDIAFAIDFEWLDHEIELFNQNYNGTHAQLAAWIRIPILSPSVDTVIRMYYGNPYIDSRENPEGVWNNNYEAVWHMNQDPSSSDILDSTSNNNDLIATGFASDVRFYDGKVGTAISVDGINDNLRNFGINGPVNDFTFQTWFKFDNTYSGGGSDMHFFHGNSATNNYPLMRFSSSTGVVVNHIEVTSDNDETCTGNKNSWAADTWFQFVYSRSMSAVRAYQYVNGSLDAEDNSGDNANPHLLWDRISILSSSVGGNNWGPGAISEFRILTVTLSSDWIATEYNNQFNPSSFYSVGNEIKDFIPSINDFEYFKEIVIDHTMVSGSNDLINFPLLISIFDSDLHDYVQPDGDDIAFNNGTSWLFHEIELFNQNYNSTHAQLIAWVSVSVLSPFIDTVIYMYYGNSTMTSRQNPKGTWVDYKSVWHFNEPSGTGDYIKDSTLNNYNGTPIGTQFFATGLIDGARSFSDVSDSRIIINQGSQIFNGDNIFTFSFWIYPNYATDQEWSTAGEPRVFYKASSISLTRIYRTYHGPGLGSFQPDI
ncbi:MAG: DUF2341 domain-containing protein, partial [Promethearchaeota archaeon]